MLTFSSKSLNRVIGFDAFSTLSLTELRALYAELFIADQSMTDSIAGVERQAQVDGVPVDKDWIHRIRKKHRVCMAFLAQIKQLLDAAVSESNVYLAYQKHMTALLVEELGSTIFKEIEDLAKERARADAQVPAALTIDFSAV